MKNKFKSKVFSFLLKAFKFNDLSPIENEKSRSQILKNISTLNSEYPFYELLENVDLISVFLDLKGKVVYCNSYMSSLTGYGQEELIGSDWFGLMVPEADPETKEVYLKGLKTGKIVKHFENHILTKTGKQHLIFWNNTLLKDPAGTIIGTASIGEDITQRRFFEKAFISAREDLEANEKIKSDLLFKMNEAQQSSKIGSWDWNMVNNNVWWSDELYRVFELNPDSFIPSVESNAKYVHPEDNISYHAEVQRVIESKEELNYDLRIITATGKMKFCNSRAKLEFDADGNPIRFHGTFSDITERKQAEENIQAERDFSNALLDGLPGIFYFYDNDFKFLRWNKNFETVSGYSGNEIANMGPIDFFSDSEKDLLKEKIGEVFTKGYSKVEADFLSKDGNRTPYFFNGLKIRYNNKDCLIGIGIDIAERKKAEAAVRESEERYRTIISNIPGGLIHIIDRDMRYVFNAGEELARLGLSNEFLVGKSIHEVLPADVASIVESQYKRVLAGETVRFEGGFGEEYYSLTSAPLRNTDGEVENILTLSVNITDRKRTEQNLIESEKRYRSLFENMNAGFVLFEVVQNEQDIPVDLIIIAANEGFEKTTGLKLRDSVGKNLTQVLPGIEKDEADWIGTYSKVALSGEPVQFEQGSELLGVYYSISAFQGGAKQCAVTFVDITERKKAENALRQSEEKFNKAFYNSPDAITITRASDGKLIDVNEAFCKLSGFNRDMVNGSSTILLNLWHDPADRVKYVYLLKENGSIKDFEAKFVTSEGTVRDFHVSGELFNLNNETCILGILRDVTALKITQNELDTLNRELEQRISERTAQLEEANKELESFSYSISHDLRAPLRAIYGFSQILAGRHRESLDEEGKQYMDYIVESSVRMEQLINDLLNYSRLGRKTVEVRLVSLKKITETIYDDFKSQIDEVGGKFLVAGNPPEILSDESLLRQIFSNLIGNSIKYRRNEEALSINISFETIQDSILIKVADNGIGLPIEHREKIFNVFQRLHSEDKYPGTGIGLANVKKAVTMLGGTIYVESEIGKGSTFVIEFSNKKPENHE
jgi:PAS domain S-box-containing protein